jgi:ketosteroid isomerase-like protein
MREPLRPVLRDIRADGEAVIVLFDASSVADDGIPYTKSYSWHLRLRDGRIAAATAVSDSIAFYEMWMRVPPTAIR